MTKNTLEKFPNLWTWIIDLIFLSLTQLGPERSNYLWNDNLQAFFRFKKNKRMVVKISFLYLLWYHLKMFSKKLSGRQLFEWCLMNCHIFSDSNWESDKSKVRSKQMFVLKTRLIERLWYTEWDFIREYYLVHYSHLPPTFFDSQKKPNDSQDKFYFLSCGCCGFGNAVSLSR